MVPAGSGGARAASSRTSFSIYPSATACSPSAGCACSSATAAADSSSGRSPPMAAAAAACCTSAATDGGGAEPGASASAEEGLEGLPRLAPGVPRCTWDTYRSSRPSRNAFGLLQV